MKKHGILNHRLAEVIARMGHTDALVLADAGLPIPPGVERVDLAVTANVPRLLDVLDAVAGEMEIERLAIASELVGGNTELAQNILQRLPNASVDQVPHERFKALTGEAIAVVRTGECTPYANVILYSGVTF